MENKNILISGAGITGVTLAFWLKKFGFTPTIVEIYPALREGGYAVDFMGAGYTVAEKMGLIPELEKVDINISKPVFVNNEGWEKGSMNYKKVKEIMKNKALTMLRSDLARVIYNSLQNEVEIIFGDTIQQIISGEENIEVTFKSGSTRSFDLVVGADGLHSNVRNLAFGNDQQFEKFFGYYTSSYTLHNYSNNGNAFSMYNVPGKQVAIYTYGQNKTAAFFIFASPEKISYRHNDLEQQKQILKEQFINAGWKCPAILAGVDSTTDFYFDSVSQVKMDQWYKGRTTLVGDACYCPSLLSGKGSTLAMVGAYVLAGELKSANGNYKIAFEQYQNILKPFMGKKQKAAQSFAKSFIPKSNFGIWLRNKLFGLMSIPIFGKLFLGQFEDRGLELKDY